MFSGVVATSRQQTSQVWQLSAFWVPRSEAISALYPIPPYELQMLRVLLVDQRFSILYFKGKCPEGSHPEGGHQLSGAPEGRDRPRCSHTSVRAPSDYNGPRRGAPPRRGGGIVLKCSDTAPQHLKCSVAQLTTLPSGYTRGNGFQLFSYYSKFF